MFVYETVSLGIVFVYETVSLEIVYEKFYIRWVILVLGARCGENTPLRARPSIKKCLLICIKLVLISSLFWIFGNTFMGSTTEVYVGVFIVHQKIFLTATFWSVYLELFPSDLL